MKKTNLYIATILFSSFLFNSHVASAGNTTDAYEPTEEEETKQKEDRERGKRLLTEAIVGLLAEAFKPNATLNIQDMADRIDTAFREHGFRENEIDRNHEPIEETEKTLKKDILELLTRASNSSSLHPSEENMKKIIYAMFRAHGFPGFGVYGDDRAKNPRQSENFTSGEVVLRPPINGLGSNYGFGFGYFGNSE